MLDARAMRFETLSYSWDPENPLSGEHPTIRDLSVHEEALAFFAAANRLALDFAVRGERHFEFGAGRWGGGSKGLTVEECRLNVARRELCRRCGKDRRNREGGENAAGRQARNPCTHRKPPQLMIRKFHHSNFTARSEPSVFTSPDRGRRCSAAYRSPTPPGWTC